MNIQLSAIKDNVLYFCVFIDRLEENLKSL